MNGCIQGQCYGNVAGNLPLYQLERREETDTKRGFATKREAQAWEHEIMLKQGAKLDMTFASFFEVYEADKKQRVKESTWESKSHVIRTKDFTVFRESKNSGD